MKETTMSTGLLIRYMINKYHYIYKIIGKYANEQVITYPHYKKKKHWKENNSKIKDKKIHNPKNMGWVAVN